MNSVYDGEPPTEAGGSGSAVGVDDKLPPRPSQPPSAFLLHKIGPELLDVVLSCASRPNEGQPVIRSRTPKRSPDLINWSLVSFGLSLAAARHIWPILVLPTDAHATFVQNLINASGGRDGRVGSSIRMIYTKYRWTKNPQVTWSLASSYSNLLRLDTPLGALGQLDKPLVVSTSAFHRLQVLTLFGNRRKNTEAFKTHWFASFVALKHLAIDIRLEMSPDCPTPSFSLTSLTWQGAHQPEAIRWLLQKSNALHVLMIRHATATLLQHCLVQHGATLLSLRLLLHGALTVDEFPQLLDQVGEFCPNLLELLWDICPDAGDFVRLPSNIQHIAIKPGRKTNIFAGDTFLDWIDDRAKIRVLTFWGGHAQNLLHRANHPHKTKHNGFNTQVHTAKTWNKSDLLHFAPAVFGHPEWPFEDTEEADYVSPVVPNLRFGCY